MGRLVPDYRYAYDKSERAFTEEQWVKAAWKHFIRLDEDTDITFALFLSSIFQDHLRGGSIGPIGKVDKESENPRMRGDMRVDSCAFCFVRSKYWVVYFCKNLHFPNNVER